MAESSPQPAYDAKGEAKALLRTAREAALATRDRASGAPFVTLVGVASDHSGAPLLLLSTLSSHTKNLAAAPGDSLNRPRLTLVGALTPTDDPKARARYLARNPKAKLYAGFADFSMFRFETSAVHFNGGFGKAAPLAPADIATDLAGAEALLSEEEALLNAVNKRGPAFLSPLAGRNARWRAIGLDPEGLDLAAGASAARVSFATPAPTPAAWLKALDARVKGAGSMT